MFANKYQPVLFCHITCNVLSVILNGAWFYIYFVHILFCEIRLIVVCVKSMAATSRSISRQMPKMLLLEKACYCIFLFIVLCFLGLLLVSFLCIFVKHQITWFLYSRKYKRLHVLEFSSSRKRMSVIVRNAENQLFLLCKGADRLETYAYLI